MSVRSDQFAEFITALSEGMDERLTSSALAGRLHLSRSQLDRVVTAVGGESPVQLRRRVSLERAAWRLISSEAAVLDVAIEAGYGSHEAFTRAFSSAYGCAPSAWRTNPTQLRLPAENGVHFSPPGGLYLPGGQQQPKGVITMISNLVDQHVRAIGALIVAARQLTEEQLDQSIEISIDGIDDQPTVRRLLSRLVGQLDMWRTVISMGNYDFAVETYESLDDLDARLARVGPIFLDQVRQADELGHWDDTFVDALCEPPKVMSYAGMVNHVLIYSGHRKTLVAGALNSAGLPGYEALGWHDDHG